MFAVHEKYLLGKTDFTLTLCKKIKWHCYVAHGSRSKVPGEKPQKTSHLSQKSSKTKNFRYKKKKKQFAPCYNLMMCLCRRPRRLLLPIPGVTQAAWSILYEGWVASICCRAHRPVADSRMACRNTG